MYVPKGDGFKAPLALFKGLRPFKEFKMSLETTMQLLSVQVFKGSKMQKSPLWGEI